MIVISRLRSMVTAFLVFMAVLGLFSLSGKIGLHRPVSLVGTLRASTTAQPQTDNLPSEIGQSQTTTIEAVESDTSRKDAIRNQPSQSETELIEGLVELLDDSSAPSARSSSDPLALIRGLMLEASIALGEDQSIQQAADLQTEALRTLDTLISQLQQARTNQASGEGSSSQQLRMASEPPVENESPTGGLAKQLIPEEDGSSVAPSDENVPTDPNVSTNADPSSSGSGNTPGNAAPVAASAVRGNNPMELQQDVWGHLPERIRSQMQSRMVEQFLPSHRRQLEAYYRALLKQEQRP